MEIVKNEQAIKTSKSLFLKLKDGDRIIIKSHLIRIFTAYINKKNILWSEKLNSKKRQEFYYFCQVNDSEGIVRIPMSVFFAMNEVERLMKKDKRHFIWIIGKKGQGLETKYTVIKGEEIEINEEEIKKNTEKLKKVLTAYEATLAKNLREILNENEEINLEENEKEEKVNLEENLNEDINPEDIPF